MSSRNASIAEDESYKLAKDVFLKTKIKTKADKDSGEDLTQALMFIGRDQADALARAAINKESDAAAIKDILKKSEDIDIALFGRMLADDPDLNVDASSQVAHAISTHAVQTEYDYYTAVDDYKGDQGAAMLGTVEFNSYTLYRYANVAVHELSGQMDGDIDKTVEVIKLYIEAFVKSMPSGKSNTFANMTLPQTLLITVREDRPVSLVSAFEKPVRSNEGFGELSTRALLKEEERVRKFADQPAANICVSDFAIDRDDITVENNLSALLDDIADKVRELM